MTKTLYASALGYIGRGWAVFPLAPLSKLPLIPKAEGGRGFHDAATNPAQIQAWWERCPRAGIGIRTGPASGLLVLDVDGEVGQESLRRLEDIYGKLPVTLTARTGRGGRHAYFVCPDGDLRNSAGRLGDGLDTRAAGGYVVAPPTPVKTGRYEWLNPGTALAVPPRWLVGKLTRKATVNMVEVPRDLALNIANRVLRERAEAVMSARAGTRNDTLNRSAFVCGQIIAAGVLDEREVESVLLESARRAGLADAEIIPTLASGLAAGRANPRAVSA